MPEMELPGAKPAGQAGARRSATGQRRAAASQARPAARPRVRVLRKVKSGEAAPAAADAAGVPHSGAPVVLPATPSVLEAPVVNSVSQVIEARAVRAAEAEAAAAALSEAVEVAPADPNPDKTLLQTADLDLFRTGKTPTPCKAVTAPAAQLCPQCQHELATVVCHGSAVGACLGCKGIWMPNPVIHELAPGSEWHQQVIAAIQTAAARVSL